MQPFFYLLLLFSAFNALLLPTSSHSAELPVISQNLSAEILRNHSKKGMEILGVLKLGNVSSGQISIPELSGLAWDPDEDILYAISDKGFLVHLRPVLSESALVDVIALKAMPLKNKQGQRLTGDYIDSEGLEAINHNNGIKGDTELLISFERIARIEKYLPDGSYQGSIRMPAFLTGISNYDNENSTLESVSIHPKHGVITAPEKLSDQYSAEQFQLFSETGQRRDFPNSGGKSGAITGLTLTKDNQLIVLERIFHNVFLGLRFALHLVDLDDGTAQHKELLKAGPEDGFFNDNFEAITHHRENYFFMISDNNNSALQRTLLVYFRLADI